MSNTGQAWVTLATNDSYALGALVLAQSLKRSNTIHQLAIMVTPGVSSPMKEALSSTFDCLKEVDVLDSKDSANLALLARPDLGITFTKLHCWTLTQYTKCVFLDADTLVVKNADELFERDELSAAPDAGWPDCFNSGVFVYKPSEDTYKSLLDFALANGSFDGGDQGLLNMFFSDWATKDITKHLPFIYNVVASATYSYLPAFKMFGSRVKIAHFIGSSKPWLQAQPGSTTLSEFLNLWWNIFLTDVSQKLNTEMGGLAGALAGGQKDVIEDQWRKQSWEQGNIDYMGVDAFENIWKKIAGTVSGGLKPIEQPVAAPVQDKPSGVPEKTEEKTEASTPTVESKQPEEPPAKVAQTAPAEPLGQAEVAPGAGDTTKQSASQPEQAQVPPESTVQAVPATVIEEPSVPTIQPAAAEEQEAQKAPQAATPVPPAAAEASKEHVTTPTDEQAPEKAQPPSVPTQSAPVASEPAQSPPVATESAQSPVAASEPAQSPAAATEPTQTPVVASEPVQPPTAATEPVQAPTAVTEPAQPPPAATEPPQSPAVVTEPSSPPTAATEPSSPPTAATEPAPSSAAATEPAPSPAALPTPPPVSEPAPPLPPKQPPKSPSPPKDDPPPSPPKDGGAEKVLTEPPTPTSPSVPSPVSPSPPESSATEAPKSPPAPADIPTPAAESSTPPQTPTDEAAPVPPKRRSTKGKGKK